MPTSQKSITACTRDCPDACSLVFDKDRQGRPILRGNPDSPFTSGFTCPKAKDFIKRLRHPDRILQPLLRKGSTWQTISWPAALDMCAHKIQQLRFEPKSILHIQGEGAKGVLKKATALFFDLLGSSRVRGSLCDAAGYMAYIHDFGSRENHDIEDLLNAAGIINWGKDLVRSSVHSAAIVKKARKRGTRVLTISPGGDGNDSFSDVQIRLRPGTDRFLAAAVMRLMIEERLISEDVFTHCKGLPRFLALIKNQSFEDLASACDVASADIDKVFSFYHEHRPAATLLGTGLQRYRFGGENVRFINALALLTGNIGRPGGGSYYQLHSFRNLNLTWTKVQKKGRRSFQFPLVGREIAAAENPPIEMIWVNGTNVVNQAPDSKQIIQAFKSVNFKVVADAFMNDTAQLADLILPSTLMLENEDIVGSFQHEYVQYVKPVLEAPGEAREDLWILSEIGRRLDPPIELPEPETCLTLSLASPFLDTSLEELKQQHYVRSNRPAIPYEDLNFDNQDGKYHFPYQLHPEPEAPAEYPLRLMSLIRREAIHSQLAPEQQKQPPDVWASPDNPFLQQLDINKPMTLVTPLGRLKVALQLLPGLHPEAVVYRRGDWISCGGGVNQLIAAGLTDMGSGAAYYDQYVRLENSD